MSASVPFDPAAWNLLPYVSPTRICLESRGRRRCTRWRVDVVRADYSAEEWLACWGPYPGTTLEISTERHYCGASARLMLGEDHSAIVQRIMQPSGTTIDTVEHRVIGRYEDRGRLYLVTEARNDA